MIRQSGSLAPRLATLPQVGRELSALKLSPLSTKKGPAATGPSAKAKLNIVIKGELVGMRAQPDGVNFLRALVIDVGIEQLLGKDVALQQEGVVFFERIEGLVE